MPTETHSLYAPEVATQISVDRCPPIGMLKLPLVAVKKTKKEEKKKEKKKRKKRKKEKRKKRFKHELVDHKKTLIFHFF